MRRRKSQRGTRRHELANSAQLLHVEHLCALFERLDRQLRQAEKVPALLTLDEVAKLLRVSRRTVYRIVAAGLLQTVQVGVVMRVHPDNMDDFFRRQRRLPDAPAEAPGVGGRSKS
jgi:excisionase family DNA binding protein